MNLYAALARAVALSLLAPAARNATANGGAVDVQDFEGLAVMTIDSAAGTGTSPTLNVTIEDSDTGTGGWAPVVPTNGAFAQVINAASTQTRTIDLSATRRFVRAVATIGGTSPSFVCNATLHALRKYQS